MHRLVTSTFPDSEIASHHLSIPALAPMQSIASLQSFATRDVDDFARHEFTAE